jgi:autotransporter-associated beta strand protein
MIYVLNPQLKQKFDSPMKTVPLHHFTLAVGLIAVVSFFAPASHAQVSFDSDTASYFQDFDGLGTNNISWTNNSTLTGWYLLGTGTNALPTVTAQSGSAASGAFYNLGTADNADRALGAQTRGGSWTGNALFGLRLFNTSGTTIDQLNISYIGEQWRSSGTIAISMALNYQKGSLANINTGTWTPVEGGGFTSPVTRSSTILDGNLATNQVNKSDISLTSLGWTTGTDLWLRWSLPQAISNQGQMLGIDNVNVTVDNVNVVLGAGNLSSIGTTNGRALVFTGVTGGNVTNNQVSSLESMTFSNGAGAINFSGNAVTNGRGGIVNNSSVTQTVSLPLSLGTNQSFNAASGNLAISGNVTNNGNTLTLAGASNTTVSGNIIGTGGLTKMDGGTALLSGNNTFTGRTTVSGGTLALGAGASLASTNINLGISGEGTLDVTALSGGITIGVGQTLAGYGTVKGNTTIATNGTLAPGNSPGILTFDGNLTLNEGSTSIFEVAGTGLAGASNGFDQALVRGDLTYGGDLRININGSFNEAGAFGGNIFQFGLERNTGNFTSVKYSFDGINYDDLTYYNASNTWQVWNNAFLNKGDNGYIGINLNTGYLTVVPEPASWALFVGGVSTVLIFRRRRQS